MGKIKQLYHSLWFKIAGTFVLVLGLLLLILTVVVNSVTQQAFTNYVTDRNTFAQNVIPTILPEDTLPVTRVLERPSTPEAPEVIISTEDDGMEVIEVVEVIEPEPIIQSVVISNVAPTIEEAPSLHFLGEVRRGVFTAVALSGIVAIVLATLLTRQVTRPLTQLRQATNALAAGQLETRVTIKAKDEVGKVADSFNQMAAQMQKQEQVRRQMVADVAHELRTPLTVMTSNLEAMQDGLIEPSAQELGILQDEAQRLSRLIEDLRLLSLADAGQLALQLTAVNVNELVTGVVKKLRPLAEAKQINLQQNLPDHSVMLPADADKLQQALLNLGDNAIRYTPVKGTVTLTAVREQKTVHLSVADTGTGIAEEDLPHLFDRFWRGDKSRSRNGGGSGLGLAIVKQIVDLHQGSIQILSPAGMGAVFTISLPVSSAELA